MNLKLYPKIYRHVRKAAKTQGLTNSAFVERSVVQCLEDQRYNAHSPSAQLSQSAILAQHHFIVLESAKLRPQLPSHLGCRLTQILDLVPQSLQIPYRELCAGYKLDRILIGGGEELRAADWTGASCVA